MFLDVGCGSASKSIQLVRKHNVYAVGLDVDRKCLREAKPHTKTSASGVIELVVADANFLPFKQNCIDVIMFLVALHHLPDTWKEVLKNCFLLLKRNGILVLKEPCLANPIYTLGVKFLRSKLGSLFAGEGKQHLSRYDGKQTAFDSNDLTETLENTGFTVEAKQFRGFATLPLEQAASRSKTLYKSMFKTVAYLTKFLDYAVENTSITQKHCSLVTIVSKKEQN